MPMARLQSGHAMSTEPAAGVTLLNAPPRSKGGMENVGSATSNTFTMTSPVTEIKCIDTYSVPLISPPGTPPNDGAEIGAIPVISLTNISIPSSWTVPATGKSESLSGASTAPNNTGAGTYTIFPDVKITIGSAVDVPSAAGVGVATTIATITGPVSELDSWVVPWTPSDKPPNFDGSDFGLARSSGYGNTAKGGPGIFYISFTLEFSLSGFGTPGVSGEPAVDWGGSPTSLDFKIGVINNYDNDRETYMAAYEETYASLTKVPELSEWQT